jgi:agmatinase
MKTKTKTYAGIPERYAAFDTAKVILTSVPFDGTSTWGKGADSGFKAFLDASANMELYNIETNSEPYRQGVFLEKPLKVKKSTPEEMVEMVFAKTQEQLKTNKLLTYFGGEHSISIGVLRAYSRKYKNLTVVQLDAHTDLRQDYLGTKYNHASRKYLQKDKVYFAHQIMDNDYGMEESLKKMTQKVYITLDLDVFDSSLMPSTGTPEPGGMQWYQVMHYLRMIFLRKQVVGFDIVELAPNPHNVAPDFLAAKLYYKMLAYYFERSGKK